MPEFPGLEKVGALSLFSKLGRDVFMPQGIFYWSGRAKKEADVNATLGTAVLKKNLLYPGADSKTITGHLPSLLGAFGNLDSEQVFPYAPIQGLPDFRKNWKSWLLYKAGSDKQRIEGLISTPVVVPGITAAIHFMTRLFVDPGEVIVCPDKRWDNYDQIMRCIGVGFEEYATFSEGTYNVQGMGEAISRVWQKSDRAVAIINFPNNPTGYSPSPAETENLKNTVRQLLDQNPGKSLILLMDDAYEGMVYDSSRSRWSAFYSMVDLHPNCLLVKMDGISKELLFYGGRVAAVTFGFPKKWVDQVGQDVLDNEFGQKLGGLIRGTLSNSSHPVQAIAARILSDLDKMVAERETTIAELGKRAQTLQKELARVTTVNLWADPFHGGFFCFINVKGKEARDIAEDSLTKHRVCVVPQSNPAWGINGVRVAYCGVEVDDIARLVEAVAAASK